ncbi:carcinoembryonic antigen-related cell adhesion molecule 5-like [Embiotoca jacksoni]|uniref:carcinoembryonic antigen-related cell adhesion molecule 5-like n=1 Tax=Embiotoca jacksoni TaxID=100190 RepID=UPI00370482BE
MLLLLLVISVAFTGLTEGSSVLPDGPLNATVGGSVMFNITLTPTETPFWSVTWFFGEESIITIGPINRTAPEYEGRITFFTSTGSLELRSLNLTDSGDYSLSVMLADGRVHLGRTTLEIYVPVSNVTVTPKSADVVEFNSSVSLSCSSSGSSLSFLWLNSSSEVTESDRVQLTDGGSTLTIVNVTRYDQGPLECHVFNPVSNGTSEPVNLSISFGPENINLTVSPSEAHFAEGSNISLSCSAVSRPAAQFLWFLNEDSLPDTGTELRLRNIKLSQSGNYSCQAFNNKTQRYQTSQTSLITVLERVANVVLTSNTIDVVEFNSSVSLSCSSSGSSLSFLWLNSSSEVTESDRVQLTDGGSTLTIVNVTRYDQGPLECHVFNPISNGTSEPVNLSISFGPEIINLTASPSEAHFEEGSNISLSCSAVSRPPALFYWFLNGVLLSDTGPELRLMNIQMSQSGNYSCQAFNNKTLRYQTSEPSAFSVLKRISGASVTPSTNLTVEGTSVNLTCDAAGSIFTREWRVKHESDGIRDDNFMLYDNNTVLSFLTLNKLDSGEYFCKISNPVSSDEPSYRLVVKYGPENVQITGQSKIHVKDNIKMICSSESVPSATYTWMLNGTVINNSAEFFKDEAELSDSGNYIYNLCPAGCIAGIVVAVAVIVALVVAAVCYMYQKK